MNIFMIFLLCLVSQKKALLVASVVLHFSLSLVNSLVQTECVHRSVSGEQRFVTTEIIFDVFIMGKYFSKDLSF